VNELHAIVWEAEPATLRYTFVSRRAETILGYPAARWLTEPGFWSGTVLHPDDREAALALRRAACADGRDYQAEYRAVAADGREVWLQDTAHVVRDRGGEPCEIRGLMVDVTERKRLEQELTRLAFQDPLSGLPNRALFLDRLAHRGCLSGRLALDGCGRGLCPRSGPGGLRARRAPRDEGALPHGGCDEGALHHAKRDEGVLQRKPAQSDNRHRPDRTVVVGTFRTPWRT
jgi:PAS domain S-box-containing protein